MNDVHRLMAEREQLRERLAAALHEEPSKALRVNALRERWAAAMDAAPGSILRVSVLRRRLAAARGAGSGTSFQISALRRRISRASRRIQSLTRAHAREHLAQVRVELAAAALADELHWTDGREVKGLPFAGRARWGDLLLNYRVHPDRKLMLIVHHIHQTGALATMHGSVDEGETVADACGRLLAER
jgi:hypothetical protein